MTPRNDFVHTLYNRYIRPHLPYKISVHNGIPVKSAVRLFDVTDEFPEYEVPLMRMVRDQVEPGDSVVVVGGGLGVSTVVAAREVGAGGDVETYEGSASQFDAVKDTVSLNRVEENVTVHHAIVGSLQDQSASEYGAAEGAKTVDPVDLPACDVLVLDCEGAEREILETMECTPRVVVVETHGFLGSPEDAVVQRLNDRGYTVVDREAEVESRGVYVLTAKAASESMEQEQ